MFGLRRALAALCLLAAVPALGGCAAPSSYAGISLAPGAADAEVQELARRARAGDKQAQLELGIRYEEGVGVPVDLERAERLYGAAAQNTGGTRLTHIQASGRTRAMTVPISSGPAVAGPAEARRRLTMLRAGQTSATATNRSAQPAGEWRARFPRGSSNVRREAVAQLVVIDYAHSRCAGELYLVPSENAVAAMRACFKATELPADCAEYRQSARNVAELVARRDGVAVLGPAAYELLSHCGLTKGGTSAPASPRSAWELTSIELLLGRDWIRAGAVHHGGEAVPATAYVGSLCYDVINSFIADFTTAELLLCNDVNRPLDSDVERYRAVLRRILRLED